MKPTPTPILTVMTTQFFVKFLTIFSFGASFTATLLLCLSMSVAQASSPEGFASTATPTVGKVTLVLGKAYLHAPGQARQRVRVGTEIKVLDQITTEVNGHVHIRFVDQALMSVRPQTRLVIEGYDFNADRPERSTVKFNLIEGVTRAISGSAVKAAPERFRLNTPIAAIGVRGTDFVVSATARTTRALVNEGTIILAPYSSECSAAALGPCAVNAVELTGLSLQLIELASNSTLPRLLPAPNVRDPDMMRDEAQQLITNAGDTGTDEAYLEGVTAIKVAADAELVANDLPATITEPNSGTPDFTPAATVATEQLTTSQLVWGRFSKGFGVQEKITLSFAEASADRKVTVGNFDYALFRPEDGFRRVDSGLGVVSFSLASAQAFYSSETGVVAMQVNGGALDINFQENRFATVLSLNHSATGAVDFLASGSLFDGGFFHSRSDTQNIAGAVSIDGTEAGYFFNKQLDNGSIQGLTLWGSGL